MFTHTTWLIIHLQKGKVHFTTLNLSWLSDLQPKTTKPDILGSRTVETGQLTTLSQYNPVLVK